MWWQFLVMIVFAMVLRISSQRNMVDTDSFAFPVRSVLIFHFIFVNLQFLLQSYKYELFTYLVILLRVYFRKKCNWILISVIQIEFSNFTFVII